MSDMCEKYTWKSDFPTYGKKYFRQHNELVKKLVSPEKLLEIDISQTNEPWEPLCEFLGTEVPEKEFPRGNDVAAFLAEAEEHTRAKYSAIFGKMLMRSSLLVVVGVAYCFLR